MLVKHVIKSADGCTIAVLTIRNRVPVIGEKVDSSLPYELEQLLLVSVLTAERREATEQDVEDDPQSPHVHRQTITCWGEKL